MEKATLDTVTEELWSDELGWMAMQHLKRAESAILKGNYSEAKAHALRAAPWLDRAVEQLEEEASLQ